MPEGAYEVLGRRDEALAGLIARHGTLNPFVWRELDDAVGGDPFAELVLQHRGPADQHGGALTVFGRIHNRASGATEKPAVSCGGGGRRRPTSGCALRSRGAYPDRMATEPPSKHGRQPRRPRHFAPYRFARFVLVVLALIGVAALALLVLGLLNVEVVTDHFHIHR